MSMFLCAICDNYADADDGCEEYKPGHPTDYNLICLDCSIERECRKEEAKERYQCLSENGEDDEVS